MTADQLEDVLGEIDNDREKLNLIDLLPRDGIPLMTTFLVRVKEFDEEKVRTGIHNRLQRAFDNRFQYDWRLDRTLRASRFREPYPEGLLGTDWRERYADLPWNPKTRAKYEMPNAECAK